MKTKFSMNARISFTIETFESNQQTTKKWRIGSAGTGDGYKTKSNNLSK